MDMCEEYRGMDEREALRMENEVIKMKLMLEHGAEFQFGGDPGALSAETEREFLNYIMDFEQQEALARETTVFDVLGSPGHFPSVDIIPEEELGARLRELLDHMEQHGIELSVFSPNVSPREVYRFITEELFRHRMLHMNMEGMITCFIYDEFHPDHPYENTRTAVNECMREIFQNGDLQWTFQYEQQLELNGVVVNGIDNFRRRINQFKHRYLNIDAIRMDASGCLIDGGSSEVSGVYELCFSTEDSHELKIGTWKVGFRYWEEMDIWMIHSIEVEGIDL